MNCFSQTKQKGFTLLELMVTIVVISIGIVGIFGLIQNTMQAAETLKLRLVAVYLAQEGVELVTNIRDNNQKQGLDWKDDIGGCSSGCQISYNGSALGPLVNDGKLNIGSNGFYSHDAGEASNFKRKIFVEDMGTYLEVESIVYWEEDSIEIIEIKVIKHLYESPFY